MLKKYSRMKSILSLAILSLTLILSACDSKDDDASTGTEVKSFGPMVFRGGPLNFIGNNLNNVTSIVLPDGIEIQASEFVNKTSTLIVIMVPEEAVSGKVIIKTAKGDIQTKTDLNILEPIVITSISPAKARPGDEITIEGTYLNLIEVAVFKDAKKVESFTSQSKTKLTLIVPEDAQTGTITLLDGEEIPNAIESKDELQITLPVPTNVAPLTIKAWGQITITGTNLDLTKEIKFGGDRSVTTFVSKTATQIVVTVPGNAQDGKIKLIAASGVGSESSQALTLVMPTLTAITPNPAKNSANITVTGTNLDLITSVVFGGDKTGAIQAGGTATQITVKVPMDAVDGTVKFNTDANKSLSSASPVTLVVPTVTLVNPTSVNTVSAPSITITGTDLDLVSEIIFAGEGNWSTKKFTSQSATSITVKVVPGSVSGKIKLITTNGASVLTPDLTIVPDVPNITNMPANAFIGGFLTIQGTNMNVQSTITFPGGIVATEFGSKTSTLIEVRVPLSVGAGPGKVKFTTSKNEILESPETNFKFAGTEPIVDAALIIRDFDETGHDLGWDNWDGLVELGSDAAIGVSGKYLHGAQASANSWKWFWGCNHSQLAKVSTTKADHVLKMDIRIDIPLAANVNFQIKLGGTDIDLGNLSGSTSGWTTITYDLSTFSNLPATIPASGDWGMMLTSGTGVNLTGLYIDNIRFQAK